MGILLSQGGQHEYTYIFPQANGIIYSEGHCDELHLGVQLSQLAFKCPTFNINRHSRIIGHLQKASILKGRDPNKDRTFWKQRLCMEKDQNLLLPFLEK